MFKYELIHFDAATVFKSPTIALTFVCLFSVSKIALAEIRCRNCEHIVNQDQIFCDKCGYQLKMECVGKTNGKPCAKLISSASKFCADCGTANLESWLLKLTGSKWFKGSFEVISRNGWMLESQY